METTIARSCVYFFVPHIFLIGYLTIIPLALVGYLTIIPRARMGYESIAHKAEGRMGY